MEWNRKNFFRLLVLLALGFGFGGVMYVREEGGLAFVVYRVKGWVARLYQGGEVKASAEEIKKAKAEAKVAYDELWKRYPDLRIEAVSVPDERNGFLAILSKQEDPLMRIFVDSQVTSHVGDPLIDIPKLQKALEPHRAILDEIERIAALPDRSSENLSVNYNGFFEARPMKVMGDYLILQARIAAQLKNEGEALRYTSLAVNFTEHLHQIESPSLLSETVLVLLRLQIRDVIIRQILPEFGKSADLASWREMMTTRDRIADRYSLLIKGEANHFRKQWLEMMFTHYYQYEMPDPMAFCMAHHQYLEALTKHYRGMSLDAFTHKSGLPYETFAKGLSKESESMLSVFEIGTRSWIHGMARACLVEAQHAAAMDLLIREKGGEDLSKRTETSLLNPLTGKPFVYHPLKRVLEGVNTAPSIVAGDMKLPW